MGGKRSSEWCDKIRQTLRQRALDKYYANPNVCLCCGKTIKVREKERPSSAKKKKFCNNSCAAQVNNRKYPKRITDKVLVCLWCGKKLEGNSKYIKKYCNTKCLVKCRSDLYIALWKRGKVSGNKAITSLNMYVRAYLLDKADNKCVKCDWNEINPKSGNIPLTVNHIDGDSTNSVESNLEVLCPNCHSLTSSYCGLYIGNGRAVKKKTYKG